MRRPPVFFVLGCSESMIGENLKKMTDGLQMIVGDLREDPHALETAWASVITFAGVARTTVPLREIASFYLPRLPAGGGTSLGTTLHELTVQINTQIRKTTHEAKGDQKPVVYLLTDGRSADDTAAEVKCWKNHYAREVSLIAVGLGPSADLSILWQLTEDVILFTESQEGDFTHFIKRITASVTAHSHSVGDGKQPELSQTEYMVRLAKDEPVKAYDESYVALTGRCSETRCPYLMEYGRPPARVSELDLSLNLNSFNIVGCYPIDEDYFTWSDTTATGLQANTNELYGVPDCLHYGNASTFALHPCGKLLCIDGLDNVICPWCETGLSFNNDDGSTNFDVNKGRG